MTRVIKSLVTIGLLGASIYYIAALIDDQYQSIGPIVSRYSTGAIVIALVCHLAGGLVNATVWHRLVVEHGAKASFPESFRAWAISRLFRYLPGKVFGYAGRVYYQQADRKTDVIAASVSDLVFSYLPIILLSLLSLAFYWPFLADFAGYFFAAAVLVVVLYFLWPAVLGQFWKLAARFEIEKPVSGIMPSRPTLLLCLALSLLAMLLHGTSLFVLIKAIQPVETGWYLFIVSAFYVSSVTGQLAVLVPAGLGVREATLAYLLSLIGIDAIAALVAVIVSRLVIVATEFLNVLFAEGLLLARR